MTTKIQKAYINGNIYTTDDENPIVNAIGISDGIFSFVGNTEELLKLIDKETEIIDLNDYFVMPGITDGHCHLFGWQLAKQSALDLSKNETVEEHIKQIREYVLTHPENKEYRGRGWVNSTFENMTPTNEELNNICNDKSIALRSNDGHSLWVNDYLLNLANITKDTPNPDGGKIEKDSIGKPVGCLRDNAMLLVQKYLDDFTVEQYKAAILEGQKYYASLGYTGYLEALINDNYTVNLYLAYKELAENKQLILHTYSNYGILPFDGYKEKLLQAKRWHEETEGNAFEVNAIKLFVDGVVEGQTALLKKPYNNNSTNYGADCWPNEEIFLEVIKTANSYNLPVHVHCIGDKATNKVIETIKKVQMELNRSDIRNVIAHLQVVDNDDISQMSKHNINALFNPWANKEKGFFYEAEVPYLGIERAENEYLVKSFIDKNVKCSFGTDFPLDPLHNPFVAMKVFMTRMNGDDEDSLLNPDERIDIHTAIKLLTNGPIYQVGKENIRGSIKVGKQADFIILNQDITKCDVKEISNTYVVINVIGGNIIFER